jgi:decaprenyl-phosphate phosphoribosyltransferase
MQPAPAPGPRSGLPLSPYIRLMRPRQWVKNLFVLAAVLFSGRFLEAGPLWDGVRAALLFCLVSSVVYIINDIFDREADRRHPIKALRPIAAGEVSIRSALLLAAALLLGAAALALTFTPALIATAAGYILLNLLYSAWLKHVVILDVFSIALSFALRVVAGGAAVGVNPSPWALLCTMGLALFLAAAKRRQELLLAERSDRMPEETRQILGQYAEGFLDKLMLLSVNLTVVCYSLFALTVRPNLAWGTPFVLYGIFRYYFIVERKGLGESPVDALFQDRPLLITVLAWMGLSVVLVILAE